MIRPINAKKTNINISNQSNLSTKEEFTEWHANLNQLTLETLQVEHRNTDRSIWNNNAFDYKLNSPQERENPLNQIIKGWRGAAKENVFNNLLSEFIFTKASKNVESIFINRDPLAQKYIKKMVTSFYNNEIVLELFHNEFFNEDNLINDSKTSIYSDIIKKSNVSKNVRLDMNK